MYNFAYEAILKFEVEGGPYRMAKKEDLRVKKTKSALNEAFLKLLSEKSFEEITVNELCDAAGVRRATFYKHYADKLSFLTAYTRSLRAKFDSSTLDIDASVPNKEYYVAYGKRIVNFISENMNAFKNIIDSELFPLVLSVILEQNYKDTCRHLSESADSGIPLVASVSSTASMFVGGIAAVIYTWLKLGKEETPEEIAEEIGSLISALLGK